MFNKFTTKSQEAVRNAQQIAIDNSNQQVDVLHLLLSLLHKEDSLVVTILKTLEVDIAKLKHLIFNQIDKLTKAQVEISIHQMFSTFPVVWVFHPNKLAVYGAGVKYFHCFGKLPFHLASERNFYAIRTLICIR